MAFSVENAVDEYVAALETPRLPDGKWHPSSIYSCARQTIYNERAVPKTDPSDARTRRVFRIGHQFHEFIQAAITEQVGGTLRAAYCEVPVEHAGLGIVGSADVLVELDNETFELIELKTIGSQAFKYRDLPKPDHIGQWVSYARCLRDYGAASIDLSPLGEKLTKGRIVYFSKDDLQIEECPVLWSDGKSLELEARIAKLDAHREGPLPDRLPLEQVKSGLQRNWLCRSYCDWRTRCWDIDGENELREDPQIAA